ncbi:MAG: sterol desaturase family protein [Ilumatobacteraceae bacterium]|nr:sterol desaturase family protein [Ilumatobacteraceae bacterium]
MTTLITSPPTASPALQELPSSPSRRWLPWAMRVAALGVVTASVAIDRTVLVVLPLLFILVVPFEKMFPRHRGQSLRRPHALLDVRYALATGLFGIVSLVFAIVIGIASLAWLPGLAIRPLVGMIPAIALPFVGIALFDLSIYWAHRWSHEVPALWRFHAVHHSTEQLDWVSGFRGHPFDGAVVAPAAVLLLAAGFDPTFTGVLAAVQIITGLFLHANVRWRWRPLHSVVITPEFHHWHHANEAEAINSNYSVFLPLWDIVFGTYYMPGNKRPLRYGVSEPIPTTMVGQLRYPFEGVRSPRTMLRHPWWAVCAGVRALRTVVRDMWRSTFRPRTHRPRPGEPCRWAATPPQR